MDGWIEDGRGEGFGFVSVSMAPTDVASGGPESVWDDVQHQRQRISS